MISPSDYLYTLRNEVARMIEELTLVATAAQELLEKLEKIADDCEDAAQLVAASDIEPHSSANVPERAGLMRRDQK